jgi:hypothetical protein
VYFQSPASFASNIPQATWKFQPIRSDLRICFTQMRNLICMLFIFENFAGWILC